MHYPIGWWRSVGWHTAHPYSTAPGCHICLWHTGWKSDSDQMVPKAISSFRAMWRFPLPGVLECQESLGVKRRCTDIRIKPMQGKVPGTHCIVAYDCVRYASRWSHPEARLSPHDAAPQSHRRVWPRDANSLRRRSSSCSVARSWRASLRANSKSFRICSCSRR